MEGPRFLAVGGGGWLGGALVRAALRERVIDPACTTVTSRRGSVEGYGAYPAVAMTADSTTAAEQADVVLLTVRPQDIDALSLDLSGKLVLSVMAMVPMADLATRFGAKRIIRAMPNAAAERDLSFTPLIASAGASEADRAFAGRFFAASGEVATVGSEDQLDYLTGLTGSGPAFFAGLAAQMERDAIARGLDPALAGRAIRQLLKGAAGDLSGTRSPSEITEIFVGYEGTTAAGLRAMQANGLGEMVRAMLDAAERKAAGVS